DPAFKKSEPLPQDFHPQAVGRVATELVNWWLRAAGSNAADFHSYWDARKDRAYCASWFAARLLRITGAITPFREERAKEVQALRKEIDRLPQLERDWILVYLASNQYNGLDATGRGHLVKHEELLLVAKRLGPDRLMGLLQGKAISDDPDLSPDSKAG